MPNLVAVVVALALAAILWRIVRWMTKRSNATATTEAGLPADKDTTKLPCDKTSAAPLSSNQSSTTEKCTLEKTNLQHSPAELICEQSRTKALETSRDILQLELAQERKLRERAEDWAEFLTCELEAHIRARIEAERRSRRLERKMNSVSPKVLTANDNKPVARNFNDINEAHETWQKTCDIQREPDHLTNKPDHDENEWHQIVDANKRFLQTVKANNKQKDNRTTSSCKTEEQFLQGNGPGPPTDNSNKGELSAEKINITVEACTSPGEEQKMLEKTITAQVKVNDNKSYEDFTKLRLPSQDQQNFEDERMKVLKGTSNSNRETNQSDTTEIDKNPLVCTDSLSNIKKTTEIWENLSASKDILSSGDDLSPTSADPEDKRGLQVSCSDITPGLVQKNLKMYETSETVENMENQ